jgi:ribonucleotide reductase alpha subunit
VKPCSDRYDWEKLRRDVMQYGARNSLLLAPMPTASTSQILGNNESFEPYTSNVYTRRVLAGEFICINPHLVADLIEAGCWDTNVKNALLAFNGSVQNIKVIPPHIKALYKTVWEIPQKALLDLAIARGPYICQSQSLNVYMAEANFAKMTSMHFYAWKKGLKTGQYYLRTRPSRDAIKFTVNIEQLLTAADSGDTSAIVQCLTLNAPAETEGVEALKAGAGEEKRDDRYMSIARVTDEDELAANRRKQGLFTQEEQEDPVFECTNCNG